MENNDKIGKNNQYELTFDSKQSEQKEEQKTWREKVGEEIFRKKMIDFRIGPGLWNEVKMDRDGNILEVTGMSYGDWNEMEERLKDKPGDLYKYRNI